MARPRARRGPVFPDGALPALQGSDRAVARRGQGLPLLLHQGRARAAARRADGAQGEAALRRPLARPHGLAPRRRSGDPLPQPARGRGGGGGPRARARGVPQQRARRPRDRARRRHADLQLLRGGGRRRHGRHACHPRRRSSQQHAAADEHARRARREDPGLRACADDPRAGRRQALQAPRRGERAAVRGGRLPARRAAQLPRAPRLVAWRPGGVHARRDDRRVRHRRCEQVGLGLQPRKAPVAQPAAPDAQRSGDRGAVPQAAPRAGGRRDRDGPGRR